jgi:hypothetical protein
MKRLAAPLRAGPLLTRCVGPYGGGGCGRCRCLALGSIPRALELYRIGRVSGEGHIFRPLVKARQVDTNHPLTMSTPCASDCLEQSSYCFGFRMFSPVRSVHKGRNVVRVPPRAQCFRRSKAFWLFSVDKA